MQRVRGIGGVFFKSKDPKALAAWYKEHLGVPVEEWGGGKFTGDGGDTVWSPFKMETEYFGPSGAGWMVNYRVDDLDAMLAQLRAAGVKVDDKVDDSEYGKFGWAFDLEGNKFELWQPPKA